MAGGKFKKAGSCSMIECMMCRMWVDLEMCKGFTEVGESEKNKLVFNCWNCVAEEKVKMADVNLKMKEEIKRLIAEVVSQRREWRMKGGKIGEDARSKRKMDGDVNSGARHVSKIDERSRFNEKTYGPWAKVSGRKKNKNDVMKGEHYRNRRMQGGVRPVID
ncbi:hypothetical protein FHG87_005411 [Trinorchestia longiramus]|nr:hypothetical protein FHG87_005411 [Trinorchestia longiramus]